MNNQSETIKELATALAKAQAAMEGAKKDSTNPHFKSKYADLESVWDAARKPLTDNGLSVVQIPLGISERGYLQVKSVLMHTSGEYIGGTIEIPAKMDAQGIGSAITYARRYALSALVGIAPEDDDGNGATGTGNGHTPPPKQEPAKTPPPTADIETVKKLKDALLTLANGDQEAAENLLHDLSFFEKDEKSFSLKWAGLEKANPKWVASTYGRAKKKLEEPAADDDIPF